MCQACDRARSAWYKAFKARSSYTEQLKQLYQEQRNLCVQYQQQREWAASGPPNPPLDEREEATR